MIVPLSRAIFVSGGVCCGDCRRGTKERYGRRVYRAERQGIGDKTMVCENCWRWYRIGRAVDDGELRHYALEFPCALYEQWGVFRDHLHEPSWGKDG